MSADDTRPLRPAPLLVGRDAGTDSLVSADDESSSFLRKLAHVPELSIQGPVPGEERPFAGTDRFVVEERLGAGGFGVVYRAFDRLRGMRVALKALRHPHPRWLYRFKLEFRALADVVHPNLVTLYDLLSDGERWFFTMELVEGSDFLSYVRSSAGAPPDTLRLRGALAQLARGVLAVHEAGKVHRDIKPPNVLVTGEGRVVLLDYGLLSEIGPGGDSDGRSIVGTPGYMSPEQAAALPASPASDWYSVGVVLYEALTGSVPFSGTSEEVLREKQRRDPLPPAELAPGVPEDLDALCRALLQRDPAARPTGHALLAALEPSAAAEPGGSGGAPSGDRAPFVGRERELQVLRGAFERCRAGAPAWVMVHGSSGIGKSALVRRFVEELRATEPRALVLGGRCYERESVPYKAVDGIADALGRHLAGLTLAARLRLLPPDIGFLARLFPVLRQEEAVLQLGGGPGDVDGRELFRKGAGALRELWRRLARDHALVLVVDDLHWGDLDSVELLAEALAPPDTPPVLIVGCHRREEARTSPVLRTLYEWLSRAWAEDGYLEVALESLDEADARRLTLDLLPASGDLPRAHVDAIAREAGGNPFFIQELARHNVEGRDVELGQVVAARVRGLPAPARALVETLAVAGRPLAPAIACQAAELPGLDPAALALLRAGHLSRTRLSGAREEVECYHDRIREGVVADLAPERLRHRHACLARILEAGGGADPELIAVHLRGAGDLGRAGAFLALAAQQAALALAFDRAVRLYREAIDLGVPGLHAPLGDALVNARRGREAVDAYRAALPGATPDDTTVLRRKAGEQLLRSGRIREGFEEARSALRSVGLDLRLSRGGALVTLLFARARLRLRGLRCELREEPEVPSAQLLQVDTSWAFTLALMVLDPLRGLVLATEHLRLALDAGERRRVARALAIEAVVRSLRPGREEDVDWLMERASALVTDPADLYTRSGLLGLRGNIAYLRGRFEETCAHNGEAERALAESCVGSHWEASSVRLYRQIALFYTGRWRELGESLEMHRPAYAAEEDLHMLCLTAAYYGWMAPVVRDDARSLWEMFREVEAACPRLAVDSIAHAVQRGRAWAHFGMGEVEEAWRVLEAVWPHLERNGTLRVTVVRVRSLALRAALAVRRARGAPGERRRLLRRAEDDARALERSGLPLGAALARLVRAGVAGARGDEETELALLERAEAPLAALHLSGHAAAARRRRGVLLGGSAGEALVREADSWFASEQVRSPERIAALFAP